MKLSKKMGTAAAAFILSGGIWASPADAATSFHDISDKYWAYPQIEKMASQGIITGFKDGTFRAQEPVTRAQSAIFIGRALKINPKQTSTMKFQDVSASGTAGYSYIVALTEQGIFSKADYFHPNRPLTRAELAKIMVTAFNLPRAKGPSFTDVPENHWAAEYIGTLAGAGITSGTTATTFSPNGKVTRGQLAVFISNILKHDQEVTTPQPPAKDTLSDAHAEVAQQILSLVNQERSKAGVKPLKYADDVAKVAQLKSEDMAKKNYFDHTSPTYGSPFDMMDRYGIGFTYAGENIAAGYSTAEAVMRGWMNSPGHRANILSANYAEMGIGIAEGGDYGIYYTQMFVKR
ncbi:S-layer homology domain-containing protein [Pseudobacillus wudalianchiensis]|uniref:S-layer homology domain-containing protein n=1 Tax=Pseudobacillus wudalianchiensis TaxID=1743143 RepID=UPI0009816348|nr:S-layer homology domain-containing protein [Bacillus wudalianchiensis]